VGARGDQRGVRSLWSYEIGAPGGALASRRWASAATAPARQHESHVGAGHLPGGISATIFARSSSSTRICHGPPGVSWSRISLNELIIVRRQWKVSIQALVMRAHDLGLLSSHQKARYYQQISARGWRKAEPGIVELEQPTTFSDALEIHRAHHRYTDAELATMIGLPQERLADLLPDYFTISGSSQARLRIIKPSAHDR
jgi:hypothetical protein